MHIWWFRDGRAGHGRQSRALIEALGRLHPVTTTESPPLGFGRLAAALAGRSPLAAPEPDLVLGAGHATHASLLAARRARGGRAVVIMRPSLPVGWFDLCVAPRHDRVGGRANALETLGPMSPVRPVESRGDAGLVLAGGPSRHYRWNEASVISQIAEAVKAVPGREWTIATSRRTPTSFLSAAREVLPAAVTFQPAAEAPDGWLDEQLPRASLSLVTPDSLSMIFDCLTAGVPCGVFELTAARGSRVAGTVAELVAEGRLGRAIDPRRLPAGAPLAEADMAARHIVEWWFS